MGRIYNVAIDSNYQYINSGNLANYSYYINWSSIMPEGSYKMTWSFMTSSQANFDNAQNGGLALNIGASNYYSTKQLNSAQSTTFVGLLGTNDIAPIHYLYADQDTNPPIFLLNRPNENVLTVTICNGINPQSLYNVPALVGEYMLILSFESVKSDL